ncbi:MAG: DAK2 domain-containing protein [Clostridiales bacterium]|nr:DAK2 domain-containing protein [Clostridiales bacterium]
MINGSLLRDAMISGAISIANKKREVDELNVYPVPDGDTGTNMSMTMSAAAKELALLDDSVSVSEVAETAASALLRGARGNSGVILSLLFRGFAKGLSGLKTASGEDVANALELGVSAAYKAVMKPTEGTILTVARLASVKARESSKSTNDVALLWQEVCDEAAATLDKTPDMLPTLKKAGVVDAGGKGLLVIFEAMLEVFKGGDIVKAENESDVPVKTQESYGTAVGNVDDEVITFTYCTEFIVNKKEDCKDASVLRAYLETIGDSVVVVDDDDIIKVHVHTDHPGKALERGMQFGALVNIKIENMREQHQSRVRENKIKAVQEFVPVKPEKKFGFVAVAMGSGIEAMFKDLGVDVIVTGGQTMNPSTDDILRAIHSTPAETVFVLPNNKNIIMAAEQAIKLADRSVCVLQTRTIPQGISAMLAFDETLDFIENRIAMTKAIEKVSTGLITFAARDSEYEGYSIKKGEILALDNNKLAFTAKDVTKAAIKLTRRLIKSDTSYITLIYGADVTDENAENLQSMLQAKVGDKIEVMLLNGGQSIYYYIISVE